MLKICLDPGHGANNRSSGKYDPGAVHSGYTEADIVLKWALTFKWVCEEAGVDCYLTRTDDRDPAPLGQRDEKAEAAGCTHYLSFHCNAGGGHGTEVYYRDEQDRKFAEQVYNCAIATLGLPKRGIKSETQSQHPRLSIFDFDGKACLLELGFIDNAQDRFKMNNRTLRIEFARRLIGELKASQGER